MLSPNHKVTSFWGYWIFCLAHYYRMALAVVVVATVAVNGQVLVEDNSVLVGPGKNTQETTGKHASIYLIHYDFCSALKHARLHMWIHVHTISVIREISGQLITTISLAHNINLWFPCLRVYWPPSNTHTLPTPNGAWSFRTSTIMWRIGTTRFTPISYPSWDFAG